VLARPHLIFGAFVVVLVAVIVAPSFIDLAGTDTDEHGSLPVPGKGVLDLPEGRVGVYYGERRRMPSERRGNTLVPDALPVPDLELRAAAVDGGAEADLDTSFVEGGQFGGTSRTTRQFGVLDVPAEGDYRVRVRSRERIEHPDPRLSLGSDSSEETEWGPSEWLLDHIQAVILAAVGLLIALMLLPRFLPGRRRGGPPPGPPPPSGPPPAGRGVRMRL
jgi:hypothetical protein